MYALLGDDIVIADEAVAKSYHFVMTEHLGLDINLSKSLVSRSGIMEFAKRLVSPTEEFTPLGPGNIMSCLRNPSTLPSIFLDFLGKGGGTDWSESDVQEALRGVPSSVLRYSQSDRECLQWSICGPFGFIDSAGFKTNMVMDSLDEVKSYDLMSSVEETLLYYYSKEWDTAFDRSLVAALGVWRKQGHPDFTRDTKLYQTTTTNAFGETNVFEAVGPDLNTHPNPHIFPSYRDLAIGALESLLEIAEKRPLKINHEEEDDFDFEKMNSMSDEDFESHLQEEEADSFYGGYYGYIRTGPKINKMIKEYPSIAPYDNPWVRPRVIRPSIRRLGIDFFKRVQRLAIAKEMEANDT